MMSEEKQQTSKSNKAFLLKMKDPQYHEQEMPPKVQQQILQAKKKDRPNLELQQWAKHGYSKTDVVQTLKICNDDIQRVALQNLSYSDFAERCIKRKQPIVITGCTEKWMNKDFWTHNYLATQFARYRFKVGEDDDGNKIKLSFHAFMHYLIRNTDDSPLYLFENITVPTKETQLILQNYTVPQLFSENLLELLEPSDRPAFKWFLVGPQRSGSGIHVDPILTCAWNTSLIGRKRWVLFDGKVAQSIASGKQFKKENETDEAIDYFIHILPKIKQKYNTKDLGLREFIQYPGETVFVPGGAWHAVLNLQDTIAVTQNFVSSVNFQEAWPSFMEQRGELVTKMLKQLKTYNHQLYERVASLSKESSQWRQTFGKKLQGLANIHQRAIFDEDQSTQFSKRVKKSLTRSKSYEHNLKSRNSQPAQKKQNFKDQQWFQ